MENLIQKKGKTITFYSYKGGVGRSMALINIACLLAKKGKKVLMVDWDLEAPGLHTFFNGDVKKTDLGLVDLIKDSEQFLIADENNNLDSLNHYFKENLNKYIKKDLILKEQKKSKKEIDFKLSLLKAGNFDTEYTAKLSSINWMDFYKNTPEYFRTFATHLEKEYDYVLIDSRTGLADTSGICTMLMPSVLVLVFALNQQNIDGVIRVCKQALEYRFKSHDERNLNIFPLPARIDGGNSKNYQHWEDIFKKEFEKLFIDVFELQECNLRNYFDIAHIKYDSGNSYGENIPVLFENVNHSSFISYEYNQFTNILDREIPIWEYLSIEEVNIIAIKAEEFKKQKRFKEAIEYSEKLIPYRSEEAVVYNFITHNLIEYSKEIQDRLQRHFIFGKAYNYSLKEYSISKNSYNLACSCSLLNKKKEAFLYLEEAMKLNQIYLSEAIKKDLEYDFINIKNEPEFIELMKRYDVKLS